MGEPHVLVVSYGQQDDEHPQFDLECSGVSDACRAWRECAEDVFPCSADPDQVDIYEELLQLVHGVEHEYYDGRTWVPTEPPACFAADALDLRDAARESLDTPVGEHVRPGRYPVRVRVDEDGGLELEPILEEVAPVAEHPAALLSGRPMAALVATANGLNAVDVGRLLHISPETVKTHLKYARWVLAARNTVHAVAIATAAGLIRPQDLEGEVGDRGAA